MEYGGTAQKKEERQLARWQYKTLATWTERVGLLLFGSLVVQQIIGGYAHFSIPVFLLGIIAATFAYYAAYYLLTKAHQ